MIKSNITGYIDLGAGPIEVQGEATTDLPLPSSEAVKEFNDEVRRMWERIKSFQMPMSIVGDTHVPTGPVVDSTLAEDCEEER